MKRQALNVSRRFYRLCFGHEMSDEVELFLKHLSFSMFGFFISSVVLFVVSIVAGRILGPAEYGRYNLVVAIAAVISVVTLLGQDSTSTKFISESRDPADKKQFFSNYIFVALISAVAVSVVVLLIAGRIAHTLKTPTLLVVLALILGELLTFKVLFENYIRSTKRFVSQAVTKITESLLVGAVFGTLVIGLGLKSYIFYVLAVLFAGLFVILNYARIAGRLQKFSRSYFKKSWPYQKFSLGVSLISTVVLNLDKFVVAKFLGIGQFGLYSAYLMSSVIIVGQIVSSLVNVFFPTVNQVEDKVMLMKRVDRFFILSCLPLFLVFALITYVIIRLFGASYQVNPLYIVFVSIISVFQVLVGLYGAIVASSVKHFFLNAKIYFAKPVFIFILYLLVYWTHVISIPAMLTIMLLSYVYDIVNCKITIRKYLTNE